MIFKKTLLKTGVANKQKELGTSEKVGVSTDEVDIKQ